MVRYLSFWTLKASLVNAIVLGGCCLEWIGLVIVDRRSVLCLLGKRVTRVHRLLVLLLIILLIHWVLVWHVLLRIERLGVLKCLLIVVLAVLLLPHELVLLHLLNWNELL